MKSEFYDSVGIYWSHATFQFQFQDAEPQNKIYTSINQVRNNTKQRIRCGWSNFLKYLCIPPEDGQQGPKHVATKI
jgi:hypothetical protein